MSLDGYPIQDGIHSFVVLHPLVVTVKWVKIFENNLKIFQKMLKIWGAYTILKNQVRVKKKKIRQLFFIYLFYVTVCYLYFVQKIGYYMSTETVHFLSISSDFLFYFLHCKNIEKHNKYICNHFFAANVLYKWYSKVKTTNISNS